MLKLKDLIVLALLIAMEIILSRVFSIELLIIKISFAFLPIAFAAMLFGPIWAGVAAALGDFLGFFLFPHPSGTAFFPGFTLTALLIGVVYGLFLYKGHVSLIKDIIRISIAAFIVTFILQLGLDTLWIQILTGTDYIVLLKMRIVRSAIMLPIQILLISLIMASKQLFPANHEATIDEEHE